jgi:hypothetical protein
VGLFVFIVPTSKEGVQVINLAGEAEDGLTVRLRDFDVRQQELVDEREVISHALRCFGVNPAKFLGTQPDVEKQRISFRRLRNFFLDFIRKSHA